MGADLHPLTQMVQRAAHGDFPAADGAVEVLPVIGGAAAVVVSFSGHAVIATSLEAAEVTGAGAGDDPGAPMDPGFLDWLARRLDASHYTPDLVLAAFATPADPAFGLVERDDLLGHRRVQLARSFRRDVRVFSDHNRRGLLTLGRDVIDKLDMSFEVEPSSRGQGLGRKLAMAARALAEDEALFASVSPGNATSLRSLLAADFTPVCSEVILLANRA